jgi:4-hydroxybenzoate polyprenyltransferase
MSSNPIQTSITNSRPSWFALFKEHVYLSRFAFTVFVPLMGAATVTPHKLPDTITLIVIIAIAWGFHMTFYGFNDVTDYELDRILGRKDDHPLVRGDMSRRTALIIAILHTASVFIIEALSGTTLTLMLLLVVACGGVIIYDVFSKRNSFPPLTDAIESIGFIALALYGATKVGVPGPLSYTLAITYGIFMNFITGSFLGIVDVEGDLKGKALTTPIWFGTRPVEGSALPYIPRGLTIFGASQIAALIIINFLPLLRNDFNYPPALRIILIVALGMVSIAVCVHTIRFIVSGPKWQKMPQDSDLDLLAVYSVLILGVSYVPYLVANWLILLAICVITPLAAGKILARL